MKYCLKYTNICTNLANADEISIRYIKDKGLVTFLDKFSKQRVNLRTNPHELFDSQLDILVAIRKQYPEFRFAVALSEYDEKTVQWLAKNEIPFYIDKPCLNWEEFNNLIAAGVCDINISGPLGFELSKVKTALSKVGRKIQLRATPNKVVNISTKTDPLIGFYIRPDDVDIYEDYIDMFEFEGLEHQDTFFSVYSKQKTFIGNLNQCIYDFGEKQVDNKGLVSLFGERRRDCGRQCLNGGNCKICYRMADLATHMGNRAKENIIDILKNEQSVIKSSAN